MKKVISLILTGVMLGASASAFAEDFIIDQKLISVIGGMDRPVKVTIADEKHYNAEEQSYDSIVFSEDNQPFIDDAGRTQLPMRKIADELGFAVDWNDAEKKITLTKDTQKVVFQIGNQDFYINDSKQTMDTSPAIVNDLTFIPLRYLGEAVGYTVEYTDRSQMFVADPITTPIEDMWKFDEVE